MREAAPDILEAAPDRHEAVLAVGQVASLGALGAQGQHAVDVVSVVCGEELLGDRLHVQRVAHRTSIGTAVGDGAGYAIVKTIRKRDRKSTRLNSSHT